MAQNVSGFSLGGWGGGGVDICVSFFPRYETRFTRKMRDRAT